MVDSSTEHDEIHEIKLCLLGNSQVGKSSLVLRFVSDKFNEYSETTIGASFMTKTMKLNGKVYKFNIWDTGGQEKYRSLVPLYYRDCNAAIIVYDITNQESFECVQDWIRELRRHGPEEVILGIAANKSDLESKRVVSTATGRDFAENILAEFKETSALNASNVKPLFEAICQKVPEDTQILSQKLAMWTPSNSVAVDKRNNCSC